MHQYSALTNFPKHKPALRKHINFSEIQINLPKHKLVSRNTSQEYIIKLNLDYRNTRENRNTLIPGPGCTHSCAVAKAHLCNEGKSSFCTGKLAGLLEVPQGSQNVDASNLFNHKNSGTGLSALLA